MTAKLYVGNLGSDITDSNLNTLFAPHGTVQSVRIVTDSGTGLSRGFGFVEMKTDQEAQAATTALHGHDAGTGPITVRAAKLRPRGERNSGGAV